MHGIAHRLYPRLAQTHTNSHRLCIVRIRIVILTILSAFSMNIVNVHAFKLKQIAVGNMNTSAFLTIYF